MNKSGQVSNPHCVVLSQL